MKRTKWGVYGGSYDRVRIGRVSGGRCKKCGKKIHKDRWLCEDCTPKWIKRKEVITSE